MKKSAGSAAAGIYGVVAQNVRNLLMRDFGPEKKGVHGRFLEKHKGVSLSKIQRASGDGHISLETLEQLAKIFKVEPFHLLLPELNVKEAQVAVGKSIVRRWQEVARELAGNEEK